MRRPEKRKLKPGVKPGGRRGAPLPRKKSALPYVMGGAAALLVIGVIVAVSMNKEPAKKKSKEPERVEHHMPREQTGPIRFDCTDSPEHEDRENLITVCTHCKQTSTFFADMERNAFICFQCSYTFDGAALKCDACGKPPKGRIQIRARN